MTPPRNVLVAFFVAATLGSLNFIAVRYSNRELDPFWGAGSRFVAASLLFLTVALVRRVALPRGFALLGAVLFGIFGFGLNYALFYWAAQEVHAGTAAILMALVPLATFFLALAHRIETFRWRGLAGGLLALAGIAILQEGARGGAEPLRILAVLGAVLGAAEASVLVKRFPRVDPFAFNAVATAVGATLLLTFSAVAGEAWRLPSRPESRWALAYLVVGGTFALFALHLFMLHRWTASGTSYGFVVTPLLSVPLAVWLDDQSLGPGLAVAALLVLAGVYVGALRPARPPAARPRPAPGPG